jgi:hypothetical protein
MASAELTVAKAALSGALFRADPRSCSRDEIESMLLLLNTAVSECSPPNVQRFKHWALSNLVPSATRVAPFCKYLVALAGSFGADGETARANDDTQSKRRLLPSAKRRRLHVLYILNDILYHVKFRTRDESFAEKLGPTLPTLVRSASSFSNAPKQIKKIRDLVALWEEQGHFDHSVADKLRAAIDEAPSPADEARDDAPSANATARAARSAPYVMPSMHGDPTTPWYDLPAGNWLPVLEPNSTRPMNPLMIKPLVLSPGPADKGLVEAVKKLLVDVEEIYSKNVDANAPIPNVSQMGELIGIDGMDDDVLGGETYYGWSREFCKKMQLRKRGGPAREGGRGRSRSARSSASYSRSPTRLRSPRRSSESPARPAFKRSRLSGSPRGRNRSRSRSPRRNHSRGRDHRRSRSYSSSRSPSSPRRPQGRGFSSTKPGHGHSRSRSYSPAPAYPTTGFRPSNNDAYMPPAAPPPFPPPPSVPPQIPPQMGFGQYHPPPPPPPALSSFYGQWPAAPFPHPPPPPQSTFQFVGGWAPAQTPAAGLPVPPPPPPPPQDTYQPYQHGQGGNGNYRGGRGGYGRGGGGRW